MKTPYRYLPIASEIFRGMRRALRRLRYAGNRVSCPVCMGRFRSWRISQGDFVCPGCDSGTRQKALWLMLEREGYLHKPCSILHFAPEPGLRRRLRSLPGIRYTTADLSAPEADVLTDITDLVFGDEKFDIVICFHVLEHVPDDGAAMREIRRVLRPGGIAFVQVPYNQDGPTDEDPTVTSPSERERRFGQFDHVRLYGVDLGDRLAASGFRVSPVSCANSIPPADMARYGLWDITIFLCRKDPEPESRAARETELQP